MRPARVRQMVVGGKAAGGIYAAPTHAHKKSCRLPSGRQQLFYILSNFYASTNVCKAQIPRTTMPRAMRYQPKTVKVCFFT